MNKNTGTLNRHEPVGRSPFDGDLPDFGSGEEFDALSDADKEWVAQFYAEGRHRAEMRPLTTAERAELKRDRAKGGRPKVRETWRQGDFAERRASLAETR